MLNRFKELIEELTPAHQGRVVQYFGDGGVLTFDSPTECVHCALALQKECKDTIKIPVRIGMHLGEVIFQNNNIFGDGVNIASRVESLSIAGGILMTKSIRDQIKNKSEFALSSLGSFAFKNIEEQMEIFALVNEGLTIPKRSDLRGKLKETADSKTSLRLAAIMFTDIVGYATLKGQDENKAKRLLQKNREIQKPLIEKYGGTWLKETDDDVLASFRSASDAVFCAKQIIKTANSEPELSLRIGIHIGDVAFKGNDIWGDGVIIASRIQELARINGILISEGVNLNVANQQGIKTRYLREETLKNVKQPVKIFAVEVDGVETKVYQPKASPAEVRHGLTKSDRRAPSLLKFVAIAIGVLVLLGLGYGYYDNWGATNTGVTNQILDKSIAVIPFENLSADEDNQYFADGQTEAILNHLTKIADLRVISRTTMMGYRGTTKSIPTIANELGVKYVLEGSVQKFGEKVRINAQLIESDSDKHLWSDNFDRDLNDIFTIQTEIAKSVAEELNATIRLEEQAALESIPTSDLTAYDFYLKGEDYLYRSRRQEDFRIAFQMFQRAVDIDKNFTLAWVGLSAASRWIYWFHYDRSDEHLNQTKEYLDKAISLDPNLVEVQIETASFYYQCELDYPRALQILNRLRSKYPKNDQLYLLVGAVYRRMGEFEKSLEHLENAIKLNPTSWNHRLDAGGTLNILRRYSKAKEQFENAIDLNPTEGLCYYYLGLTYFSTGEIEKAKQLMMNNQTLDNPGLNSLWSQSEVVQRNYLEAISILVASSHTVWDHQFAYAPKPLQLGLIYFQMADKKMSSIHFEKAKSDIEEKINNLQGDSRLYSSLGISYAGLGMIEEAIENGNKALAIMNISVDAWKGFYRELDMAKILVMVGRHGEAIEKLHFLLEQNGYLSVAMLKADPFWDPLREMEDFKGLIENPEYQINL